MLTILSIPFPERSQEDLLGALKCFGQAVTKFLLSAEENTQNEPLLTPFFNLLFELCLLVYFIFAFQDFQNSVPWASVCSSL